METIRRGSRGHYTELCQLALVRSGYLNGAVDGIFGPATENAVRRFQQAAGIAADGIVGAETWKRLLPYLTGSVRRVIRAGDTFYTLAETFYTTPAAIAAANPNADPNNLRPGELLTIPFGFDVVPENVSWSGDLCVIVCEGLAARYPAWLSQRIIGRSVAGQELICLTAAGGTGAAGKLMMNGSHHANEWITTPLLLKFMEQYAKALAFGGSVGGADAAALQKSCTLFAVPMVNPDGVDLVTGAISSGVWYDGAKGIAASFPRIPFPAGWKANIMGTDLNLNYPAGWEQARQIKYAQGFDRPAPRDYVGPAPLSAPESAALAAFSQREQFDRTLSFHTQGEVIYWRYRNIEPAGAEELARKMSAVSGYAVADVPFESGFAGYKDWFVQTFCKPGYTIEAGRGENPLPLSQLPALWKACAPLIAAAMVPSPAG